MSGETALETFHREMDGWLADLSQKPSTFAEADRFYTFGSTPKEAAELLRDERAQAAKSAVQHTPGPWSLDEDDLSVSAEVGAHICQVSGVDDFPCLDPETHDEESVQAECLANALLISAAPDLLAALKGLLFADGTHISALHEAGQAAHAAIAKAEGRR